MHKIVAGPLLAHGQRDIAELAVAVGSGSGRRAVAGQARHEEARLDLFHRVRAGRHDVVRAFDEVVGSVGAGQGKRREGVVAVGLGQFDGDAGNADFAGLFLPVAVGVHVGKARDLDGAPMRMATVATLETLPLLSATVYWKLSPPM